MTLGEIFTLLGFLTGALVLWRWSRAQNLNTQGMKSVALAGIVGGVAGAKITQWLIGDGGVSGAILNPHNGGKSLVGGLVCGWLAVEIAKRVLGIKRSTGDGWALALPAGEAVGRIGCYFNGCCFGTPCDASWAIYGHGAWRHPAQLYSGAAAALIFVVIWFARPLLKREGDGFKLYLLLYGASRFAIEFARTRSLVWHDLSLVQIICLQSAVIAAILLAWNHWQTRASTQTS